MWQQASDNQTDEELKASEFKVTMDARHTAIEGMKVPLAK